MDIRNEIKSIAKQVKLLYKRQSAQPKVYTALLTQSETDAPIEIETSNTIGVITTRYDAVGYYALVSNGLFTLNKTQIYTNSIVIVKYQDVNTILIINNDGNAGFSDLSIKIEVYN